MTLSVVGILAFLITNYIQLNRQKNRSQNKNYTTVSIAIEALVKLSDTITSNSELNKNLLEISQFLEHSLPPLHRIMQNKHKKSRKNNDENHNPNRRHPVNAK